MRTMMVVNSLEQGAAPSSKGALAFTAKGVYFDTTADPSQAADGVALDKQDVIQIINSLGNGSFKGFTLNPYNFEYRKFAGGSVTSDTVVVTYPTGTAPVAVDYVAGGITIQEVDTVNNVRRTKKVIPINVQSSEWSDIQPAVHAALISSGYLTQSASNQNVVTYTLASKNIVISFTGDILNISQKKHFGSNSVITGTEVAQLEQELAPNMGGNNSLDKDVLFSKDNFIAELDSNYSVITIETQLPAQRPLILGSTGFVKTLTLYFKADGGDGDAAYNSVANFLDVVKANPTHISTSFA